MEHEMYVPFPVGVVQSALAEPERVARCIPGLQEDPREGSEEVPGAGMEQAAIAGRLRVRIAGSTITYRGSLSLIERDGAVVVEGQGSEARGSGWAKLALTVTPRTAEDGTGTTLACSGTVRGEGRIASLEEKQIAAAGRRLLDRFTTALTESIAADAAAWGTAGDAADEQGPGEPPMAAGIGGPDANERAIPGIPAPESPDQSPPPGAGVERQAEAEAEAERWAASDDDRAIPGIPAPDSGGIQPPSDAAPEMPGEDAELGESMFGDPELGDLGLGDAGLGDIEFEEGGLEDAEGEDVEALGAQIPQPSFDPLGDEPVGGEGEMPAAEAAHARRTMIGRSAEEVDHAPPRGRYAPVPPPRTSSAFALLRWAAPVAAFAFTSAVVLSRVLRRRR